MSDETTIQGLAETTMPTAVADGASVKMLLDEHGKVWVKNKDIEIVDVTLVLDTNQYAANDVLVIPQILTACLLENGGKAILDSVVLLDKDDQGIAMDLVFSQVVTTLGTINGAVSISDANAAYILGTLNIATGDYVDLIGSQIATKLNVGMYLEGASGADDIYIGAITRGGTPTYTASGITVRLGLKRY